jgi:hypothetical protein
VGVKKEVKKLVSLKLVAERLFSPEGKNPYYKGGIAIENFEELRTHLEEFEEYEAPWLASWFEYLGDTTLSNRVKKDPKNFKKTIIKRYEQLQRYR